MMNTFTSRLYIERKRKRLSQEELASEVGITRVAYANIEAGRSVPVLTTVIKISEKLNCSVDYLIGITDIKDISKIPKNIYGELQGIIIAIENSPEITDQAKNDALTLLKITKRIINE